MSPGAVKGEAKNTDRRYRAPSAGQCCERGSGGEGGGNCQRVCSRPVGRNHSREAEVAQLDVSFRVE